MVLSSKKEIQVEIEAANLGPHRQLKAKLNVVKLEMGLFANNGSGKTFLSRIFRLVTKPDVTVDEVNRLLTLGQSHSTFSFKIASPDRDKNLSIFLKRGNPPSISNNTDLIFHVFNNDYVKENLDELGYKPNGTIEGFILGKEKIDLSREKGNLEKIKNKYKEKTELLGSAIDKVRKTIEDVGVRKNTAEFSAINSENLIAHPDKYEEAESFQELNSRLAKLKTFPDNIADIPRANTIDTPSLLGEIETFLKSKFTRSSLAEEFKLKIKGKQDFVEKGLALKGNTNLCPFCEQSFSSSSLTLLDQYTEYLNDAEAQQIKKANEYTAGIGRLKDTLAHAYTNSVKTNSRFNELKSYLPSLEKTNLSLMRDPSELNANFDVIILQINNKKSDVGKAIEEEKFGNDFAVVKDWIMKTNESIGLNAKTFEVFNQKKNNVQSERLELNKRLCKAAYCEISVNQQPLIETIKQLADEIVFSEKEIAGKEETAKVSKKDKIAATFEYFLGQFFSKKYTFDKTSFCLKFQDHSLTDNASDVLSEGEKSIVAFCYFLAETHKIVSSQRDYKRLFFVIDDPISSLDFHFVYGVAQTIRSLRFSFPDSTIQYLVLTHNLEFMSILTRNNILEDKFILFGGTIQELGRNLIMPYEEHLRDLYSVATGNTQPTHTTPNSIRHVLETLNRFSYPNLNLMNFCQKIEDFQKNAFLFSLIHDSSHGSIRTQTPYTNEMIQTGCALIIEYLKKNHSGQVEVLKP